MRLRDLEVAEVGPPPVSRQPLALVEDLQLEVADHVPAEDSGQPGAVDADRPPELQPRQRRLGPMRQILDLDEVDHLGVPGVPEPGPLIEGANMRPLLGDAVHAGHGQLAAGLLAGDAPLVHQPGAGVDQLLRRLRGVRPVRIAADRGLGPEQQPADVADTPIVRAYPVVGRVAQQERRRGDAIVLLGDQGHPLAHPRVDDELAGLALELAEHGGDRYAHAGHDRRRMRVHQPGQLIPVTAMEPAHLDRRHGQASSAKH
jgi:hypothetical protein